jgi:cysteine desulfurase
MTNKMIYLDYHATTPVDERVLDAMLPYFRERFGNAASRSHDFGWKADSAVGVARAQVASLIGAASPREISFTSGATESNNLALRGVLEALSGFDLAGRHVIVSAIEHPCILETAARLQSMGAEVTEVGVDADGLVSVREIEAAIRPETVIISVMAVNNEVGTIQPIGEIGRVAREHGVLFHCDAAQAAGRISIDVERDCIDLLSLSAHKLYGPKGVGALYVRRFPQRVPLARQVDGGGQEFGLRSGTLNVPGIVGFGAAASIAADEWQSDSQRIRKLRDRFVHEISERFPDVQVHGSLEHRVAGNINLRFAGITGESLIAAAPGLAFSVGSACASGKPTRSHVLQAMGIDDNQARGALRIGLGRFTTPQDIDAAIEEIATAVQRLRARASSPLVRAQQFKIACAQ